MKNYLLIGLITLGFIQISRGCSSGLDRVSESLVVLRVQAFIYRQGSIESLACLKECVESSFLLDELLTKDENEAFKAKCKQRDSKVISHLTGIGSQKARDGVVNYLDNLEVESAAVDLCLMKKPLHLPVSQIGCVGPVTLRQYARLNISEFLAGRLSQAKPSLKRKRS